MAIAVAAGVTAAAAAATAASQAGAFGGGDSAGGGGGSAYIPPTRREAIFSRGTADIMDAERSILGDAIAQGKLLEPEMYRALGLEPIYDRPEDPGYAEASSALAASQERANALRVQRVQLNTSRPGAGLKGPARQKAINAKKRQSKQLVRELNRVERESGILAKDVEQRGAVGRRVVGFKPIAGVADPTGSAGNAFGAALDQFNDHLADALAGKEPLDPTLRSSFDERERMLRERMRRQGIDETSTAGLQMLGNFDRERSEAYAQDNRQSIQMYSGLAEGRAGALQELTAGKLRNLAFPASFRAELGKTLEGAAQARTQFSQGPAAEREAQQNAAGQAIGQSRLASLQANERRNALIGAGASGVASAAPAVGEWFANRGVAQPTQVQVPSYSGGVMTPKPSLGGLLN